jgi:GTPase Era involved in 16S rRNA processing
MCLFSKILILFAAGLVFLACSRVEKAESVEKAKTPERTSEEVERLRGEIESGQQTVEDLQAFLEMEEAKLEENPEYTQEFLLEALHEQQQAKESIQENRELLKELAGES